MFTEQLEELAKIKGFPEAVVRIQTAIRTYNAWKNLQRISMCPFSIHLTK
jgi:hypothetical protein